MAVGDAASAAGYPLVPPEGEEGKVRDGYLEINRTRDLLAGVQIQIPVGKQGYRDAAGISSGTAEPTGGSDGDIYFKIV